MVLSQGLTLLIVGGVAAAVSGLVTPMGARWALRWGVVDRPSARKQHERPVALLGGVSVLVSVVICTGVAIWLTGQGVTADYSTDPTYGFLTGCWLGASILAVVKRSLIIFCRRAVLLKTVFNSSVSSCRPEDEVFFIRIEMKL